MESPIELPHSPTRGRRCAARKAATLKVPRLWEVHLSTASKFCGFSWSQHIVGKMDGGWGWGWECRGRWGDWGTGVWGGGEVRFVKFELWGISVIKFTWTPRLVQWLREALLSSQEPTMPVST